MCVCVHHVEAVLVGGGAMVVVVVESLFSPQPVYIRCQFARGSCWAVSDAPFASIADFFFPFCCCPVDEKLQEI